MVSLRAIEHRSWLIRATTTGISAFVDPWGRIVARTAESEEAILSFELVPVHVTTLYERIGDSFAWACVALALLAVGSSYRFKSR